MRRGTTPLHKFYVDADLSDLDVLYITYEQNGSVVLEKELEEVEINVEEKMISTRLSQDETLLFDATGKNGTMSEFTFINDDRVRIQIRWRRNDDRAYASDIITTTVEEILKDGEI